MAKVDSAGRVTLLPATTFLDTNGALEGAFILGVELLKRFKEEFANFEKERQELANAEKLFGLSITLYPELLDMEKELKGLDQIFSIYNNQKASIAPPCHSC